MVKEMWLYESVVSLLRFRVAYFIFFPLFFSAVDSRFLFTGFLRSRPTKAPEACRLGPFALWAITLRRAVLSPPKRPPRRKAPLVHRGADSAVKATCSWNQSHLLPHVITLLPVTTPSES